MTSTGPHRPVALTIAGSDSSGGAGLQVDLKVFTMLGCVGASAVTAITAQNTRGVQQVAMLDPQLVAAQIDAVADDLPVAALKTGMLGTVGIIEAVADALQRHRLPNIVIDPVMTAKSGDPLIDDDAVAAVAQRLLPLAAIATPNRHEAARLLGADTIESRDAATEAARALCERFTLQACVVKGIREGDRMVDVFHKGRDTTVLEAPFHTRGGTHGSGCAFAAAIAGHLAQGLDLPGAVHAAKTYIDRAIGDAPPLGSGTRPVDPLVGYSPSIASNSRL